MCPQATITEFQNLTEGSTIYVRVSTLLTDKATVVLLNKEQRDHFVALVDSEDPNDDGALVESTEMLHLSRDKQHGTFTVGPVSSVAARLADVKMR